jgi:hypothetical protein
MRRGRVCSALGDICLALAALHHSADVRSSESFIVNWPMRPSVDTTQQRRARRGDSSSRGHVRPLGAQDPASEDRELRRMKPRDQAWSGTPVSVTQRRAERRARKTRVQAKRSTSRRRVSVWQVFSWRAVSGMLVLGLGVVLYLFLTMDAFYVSSVAIGGEKYLSREEIFRYSDIARRQIFWIDPDEVEARLKAVPNIADASVLVGWPPDMVQIVVTEREPALTWEQGVRVWVDVNGIVMKQREDRPDLLRVVVPDAPEPIGVGERIPQSIVEGARFLKKRHPNIDVLLYDSLKGLGYHDGRGWTVWFGTGEDMDTKLLVYNQLVTEITGKVQPGEIIMTDPDRPYYTVLWYEGQ